MSRAAVRFAGRLAKLGNTLDECEDAFSSSSSRFAVSDGATESSYSSVWAEILTRTFCTVEDGLDTPETIGAWLEASRQEWRVWEASVAARENLPWFTRDKLRSGAFATFAGISFRDSQWVVFALGDTCVFVVREDTLVHSFPLSSGAEFGTSPALLSSRDDDLPIEESRLLAGSASRGDRIYLTTDALAHWFVDDFEAGRKPWDALDGISSIEDLEIFVSEERAGLRMRNDDVALLSLEIVDD